MKATTVGDLLEKLKEVDPAREIVFVYDGKLVMEFDRTVVHLKEPVIQVHFKPLDHETTTA